ncbi:MAG: hypothetical protein MI755_22690, partial [Sphingomonadales bacterium]|nr:hypothetical protein [Sphingomonadales bacterium]
MRITIETESSESVAVTQDGAVKASDAPESLDGGGAPQALIELLGGELADAEVDPDASEQVDGAGSGSEEDAGAAPDWLVDIIEGASSIGAGGDDTD